jgi:REP element-mobilizing transposase RayT
MRTHKRIVIGHHLILHGYGHWLPNDPRGSGSSEIRQEKLADLGPVHRGRKRTQPPRDELRKFSSAASERLDFPLVWFDTAKRQALGEAIHEATKAAGYTVWACAIMQNHIHLCVRRHRDDALAIWNHFADATRQQLGLNAEPGEEHPIWSDRPYKVFLYTPEDVRRVIAYIEENPVLARLAPQNWEFVTKYDGFPGKRAR